MSVETPSQTVPNLGELKEQYKQKLDRILYKELTPDNIDKFADEALDDLVALTDDVLDKYKTDSQFGANLELGKQQQEDDAFTKLDLPNIREILQKVIEVRDKIEGLKDYIGHKIESTDTVITPPQLDYYREIAGGTGQGIEDKALIPRLLTLLYLLETDLEIAKDEVKITEGIVTLQMMRKTPYVRVEIPDLKRVAYLCDEEGNVSYVFDTEKLEQAGLRLEEIDVDDKRDKNSLITMYPGIGARVVYTKHWRDNMTNVLSEPIPEKSAQTPDTSEKKGLTQISEFDEKKEKLVFADFRKEVRALYNDQSNSYTWYMEERNKHLNWPKAPGHYYKNKGWDGWSDLVGKENKFTTGFLSLSDLKDEVMKLYPGEGIVDKWYNIEKRNHPNWVSNPDRHFRNKGWLGWSELVGKENPLKREFLSFEDFIEQVRSLYPGKGKTQEWYREERKKHKDWPSEPQFEYEDKGWEGWSEMVGKERQGSDFLSYDDFITEVQALYPGELDAQDWYKKEKKKHKNWHSAPHIFYKDKGWKDWSTMVGNENPINNEFLTFDDFKKEVSALYPGKGGISVWYNKERKKHWNWPSQPYAQYKGKGWESWGELIGK